MSARVVLRDIASARAGDKGNVSNIAVIADTDAAFAAICAQVTPERLKAAFPTLFRGGIRRYEIAHLRALNFVIEAGLAGGVNASLNLDAHGKSYSSLLLGLTVELPDEDAPAVAEPDQGRGG